MKPLCLKPEPPPKFFQDIFSLRIGYLTLTPKDWQGTWFDFTAVGFKVCKLISLHKHTVSVPKF